MKKWACILSLLVMGYGCDNSSSKGVSYRIHIIPILNTNCLSFGCHLQDDNRYNMSTYSTMFRNVDSVQVIVPYNADGSLLYLKLTEPPTGDLMPVSPPAPQSPLPAEEIELIENWINDGAPEN